MSIKSALYKFDYYPHLFNKKSDKVAEIIKSNNLFKPDYQIYFLDAYSESTIGIAPYFNDVKFYNIFGCEKYSKEGIKHANYNPYLPIDTDNLTESFDRTKKQIGITSKKRILLLYKGKKQNIVLTPIYINKDPVFAILEMKAVKN